MTKSHCTSSPARDWARNHVIYSSEERPIRSVSTLASKSRTPPATAARVLIGNYRNQVGHACVGKKHSRLPQGLTCRGLNSLWSLVLDHRTASANGSAVRREDVLDTTKDHDGGIIVQVATSQVTSSKLCNTLKPIPDRQSNISSAST
jgi:hypothetical protein